MDPHPSSAPGVSRPPARPAFLAGCIVVLLTSVAHTIGHLSGPAAPKTDDEATMLRLLQSVPLEMMGVTRTMWDVIGGLSWMFSGSFLLVGVRGVGVWWKRRGDRWLVRFTAACLAGFLFIMTAMSAALFPPPPTGFFALAGLLFAAAAAARG